MVRALQFACGLCDGLREQLDRTARVGIATVTPPDCSMGGFGGLVRSRLSQACKLRCQSAAIVRALTFAVLANPQIPALARPKSGLKLPVFRQQRQVETWPTSDHGGGWGDVRWGRERWPFSSAMPTH